jgi:hypothetical protein
VFSVTAREQFLEPHKTVGKLEPLESHVKSAHANDVATCASFVIAAYESGEQANTKVTGAKSLRFALRTSVGTHNVKPSSQFTYNETLLELPGVTLPLATPVSTLTPIYSLEHSNASTLFLC